MTARYYIHTADPRLNCQLPSGELVKRGSTVRIDLTELPDWSAPVKWVRLGWLTPADDASLSDVDNGHDVGDHEHTVTLEDSPQSTHSECDLVQDPDTDADLEMTDRDWLESHTVRELRAMCVDLEIAYNGLRKVDLIDAILEA